ncbi:hypothetical protein LZ554_000551 [Drepanopeziza brunnea f. sp. 'monogermtubi']|nr:hypothetical protein LZ554_000551 [Drepanopeziza brunnea f. sp. 'monogermtubi']
MFSPRRGSIDRHGKDFAESDSKVARADVFVLSNNEVIRVGVRKVQDPENLGNVRLRGGTWDADGTIRRKEFRGVAAPYVQNELLGQRGALIGDKIKFFDGTVSTGNNTRAMNTVVTNTPSSLSRKQVCDKNFLLTPSTVSSRRTHVRNNQVDALTPTKSSQTSPAKQCLAGPSPSHALAPSSPSKSPISKNTLRTLDSYGKYRYRQEGSPSISSIQSLRNRRQRNAVLDTRQHTALGGDGSPPFMGEMPDESIRPLSRRRLSNKISELYSAKSLEKRNTFPQEYTAEQASSVAITARNTEHNLVTAKPGRKSVRERKNSKVAAMRKIFDRNFASKSSSSDGPPAPPIPVAEHSLSVPEEKRQQNDTFGIPPPPAPPVPPLVPCSQSKMESMVMPRIMQELTSTVGDAPQTSMTWPSQPSSPNKKLSTPKSKTFGEKLKIFENVSQNTDKPAPPIQRRRTIFRRKLSKSLRSLFEPPSRKSQDEAEAEKTMMQNGEPAKKDRVLSPDGNGTIGKRSTVVGRWNRFPPAPVSSGGDGTMSERQSLSQADEERVHMVIKGVECGLKEPRPVRAIEMERMVLLCRDRNGDILEKGGVGQSSTRRRI